MAVILPPVPNTIKVQQGWHVGNNVRAENVLHFEVSGGPPSATVCAALAADIAGQFVTSWKSLTHPSNSIGTCTVTDISSTSGLSGVGGTVTAGTLASSHVLIASSSVVMNHQIARRYRGGHPRSYLPVYASEELQSPGTWSATNVSGANSTWASMITAILAFSSGGVSISSFVCVSYYAGGALRATPLVETITSSLASSKVGSQRRRIKGA